MGRKGPRAKTKIVLKSVKQWEQLGNMHNLKFQTFLNKNNINSRYKISKEEGANLNVRGGARRGFGGFSDDLSVA